MAGHGWGPARQGAGLEQPQGSAAGSGEQARRSPQPPTAAVAAPAPTRCQIILHPKWGSSVYPASMFTKAPLPAVVEAIDGAVAALRDQLC